MIALLEINGVLQEQMQELKDEIARQKGRKPKLWTKPSTLEKGPRGQKKQGIVEKRPDRASGRIRLNSRLEKKYPMPKTLRRVSS